MHYDINISLKGKHFFATSPRSCRDVYDLAAVLSVLQAKFPTSEGYRISVTEWREVGTPLEGEALTSLLRSGATSTINPR